MIKKVIALSICILSSDLALGQSPVLTARGDVILEALEAIKNNNLIDADSTFTVLSAWDNYQNIAQVDQEYLYLYSDSVFGQVPVRVFVPKGYNNSSKSPLVLLLHGAVGRSSFATAVKPGVDESDEDIFFRYLAEQGFVIVRPIADRSKQFDWVVNHFKSRQNLTYNTLTGVVEELKKILSGSCVAQELEHYQL